MAIFNMVGWGWWGGSTPNYLCFTANSAWSTVKLNKTWSPTSVTLETSVDGINWSTYTIGDTITLNNIFDKVYFRNTSTTDTWFSTSTSNYYQFSMSGEIIWSWDVNYLLNKNSTDTVSSNCYARLFWWCTSLITAPLFPATNLASYCYRGTFYWCTSLLTAQAILPATTLPSRSYQSMFQNCSSLSNAPAILATTVSDYSCNAMFNNCKNLVNSQQILRALTVSNNTYSSMFEWCTNLKTAPKLPATTLWASCYSSMFRDCTNLEKLPELPATTLSNYCYMLMFFNCSKIKLSTSKTWDYQTAYRIPKSWTGTEGTASINSMFSWTGWTFTWTPSINTTYYTSNTVV